MKNQISVEAITPQKAKELLGTNTEGQRHIRPSYVARLAAEMAAGKWLLSNDAIIIQGGRLINGQHRLTAVIETGKTCEFIVLRTDNPGQLYSIIDSGRPRSVGDALKFLAVDYYNQISSISRLVLGYQKGLLTQSGTLPSRSIDGKIVSILTRSDIIEYGRKHKEALHSICTEVSRMSANKPFINRTIAGSFLEIARQADKQKDAEEFMGLVMNGAPVGTPGYLLRERLINNAISKAKLHPSYLFALYIKAFNFYLRKEVSRLQVREGEPFPMLDQD